jgi:hypothetical protein
VESITLRDAEQKQLQKEKEIIKISEEKKRQK